jgi:hypothetical protein
MTASGPEPTNYNVRCYFISRLPFGSSNGSTREPQYLTPAPSNKRAGSEVTVCYASRHFLPSGIERDPCDGVESEGFRPHRH